MKVQRLLGRSLMRDEGIALLRIWLGVVMIAHGQSKLFGDMAGFTSGVVDMGLPIPDFFAWAAVLSEFVGGIFLVLGLFSRPAAFFVMTTMLVAAFVRMIDAPFFGKEKAITYALIALVILIVGPGKASVDRWMMNRAGSGPH